MQNKTPAGLYHRQTSGGGKTATSKKQRKRRRLELEEGFLHVVKNNSSWIPNNIVMRQCIRFTPDPKETDPLLDDPKCQCGYRQSHHDDRYLSNPDTNAPWKTETHTHTCATNAFGEIEFIGAAGTGLGLKLGKYVRVNHSVHPSLLMQLLNTQWNLGTPKLLISVTGGANNFHMNNKLKNVFRKGLIKAALSTGAWIITGGTNAGIMKYVGDAIRDYSLASGTASRSSVTAIGFASWGVIDQQEALIGEKGRFPASYRMDTKKPNGVLLDPNHTHFILADNGTVGKFGVEINLRAAMEKEISEQKVFGNPSVSVPVVCVVIEGGPNTIKTVYKAVMHGTPGVIVAGSGRAADILAFAFQRAPQEERTVKDSAGNTKKEKVTIISELLLMHLADMISKTFSEESEDNVELHISRIKEMLNQRHLITIYELGSGDIDSAILHALLSANKGSKQDQLQLALIWNRVDVARREIFTEDIEWKEGELHNALHCALVNDQVEFVKLFMENGVSLKYFLTVRELTLLYNEVKNTTLLYELLDKQKSKNQRYFTLVDVGKVIQELTMDTYEPLYLRKSKKYFLSDTDIEEGGQAVHESSFSVTQGVRESANGMVQPASVQKNAKDFHRPLRELFMYSVMQNRDKMAQMFWEEGKEAIAGALTASKILSSLAAKDPDPDQSTVMELQAACYEDLALGVLNECYNDNPERTSLLLVREQDSWGNTTNLSLAKNAENRKFISHSGVQNLLNEIWNGKLSDENHYWVIWMCSFLPFLIPFFIKFREDEVDEADIKEMKRRQTVQRQQPKVAIYASAANGDNPMTPLSKTHDDSSSMNQDDNLNGASVSNAELMAKDEQVREEKHYTETADIDIINSGKQLAWWQRFSLFYNAPIIKFRHNVVSYLLFLVLFSYIILSNFKADISVAEIVLIAWVGSLYLEELRQIAQGESKSWRSRFWAWISDYWNMVDVATLVLFGIGMVLRFFHPMLDYARIILALDLAIFYIRVLQIFSVNQNLGPKLIMIAKMMVDLGFFVAILFVFLVAYGVASQAILYPNSTSFQEVIVGVFFKAYFQMYGELFLEEIQGDNGCSNNATLISAGVPRCAEYSTIGIILLAIYMMLSNILLLNLLIAMFSYTFSAVQENTDVFWRFQRYDLIKEYFNRPAIVPPFIIIAHVFFLCRFLIQKICKCCLRYHTGVLKQRVSPRLYKQLVLWETLQSDEYIAKEKILSESDINERVKTTSERVDELLGKMDELFADPETGTPSRALGLIGEKAMEERLNRLEDQIMRTNEAVDWIITALSDNHLGSKDGPPALREIKSREEDINFALEGEMDFKVPTTLEELGIALHRKARSSPYPGTAIRRFPVPDGKVKWEVNFTGYRPINYTHSSVLALPHYADIDLLKYNRKERPMLNFNMLDTSVNYDRVSFTGSYTVKDGIPQNPKGRTGMIGRGLLGRFGPNHAADPIVTRWKKSLDGSFLADGSQNVLEFIAVQRRDNQQWAIPGGMVEPGSVVSETLRREFGEEALGSLDKTEEETAVISQKIQELFTNGVEVYKGYVDDPRNTDNAWMETVAMNFHDEDGSSVGLLELQAGDDAQGVRWQRVSSNIPLFASHQAMLRKVAELHNAAF